MLDRFCRLAPIVAVTLALAACAPVEGTVPLATPDGGATGGTGPQYEPGDPCKGVVPQLCAYDSPSPEVG
ncbi:hypothetical protein [Palleronia abyssalis]|uniref:Lipoprotein n=1 Tax=Palleronia abyssalis TaxID=1501240 RepID=A0A2R8BVS6_9RHOB|nr:hypothetical protein [Palleronia abyssalis]SPJ24267.1 hypothetical protein PAA8504_02095 [Palleronia abyssalis]